MFRHVRSQDKQCNIFMYRFSLRWTQIEENVAFSLVENRMGDGPVMVL